MNELRKTFPQIEHLDDLFDIVGKTVENVSYDASWYRVIIEFTDGTVLTIIPTDQIERISLV